MVFIIHNEETALLPNFYKFVMETIPNQVYHPELMSAFFTAACPNYHWWEIPEILPLIKVPFIFGTTPRITTSRKRHSDVNFHEYDHLTQTIHFSEQGAREFEGNSTDAGYQNYVKASILHELVHHVDFMLDGEFEDYEIKGGTTTIRPGVYERGYLFEDLAFGGTVMPSGKVVKGLGK
jgi:hypothetical protein